MDDVGNLVEDRLDRLAFFVHAFEDLVEAEAGVVEEDVPRGWRHDIGCRSETGHFTIAETLEHPKDSPQKLVFELLPRPVAVLEHYP